MEFAWNTQKNKMSDIKGKEMEQERQGKISNEEIDLNKTYKNYDLVESNLNLYQRIKNRIEEVRDNSRIQKNSVVSYSNIVTVNKETFKEWGDEKSKKYLEEVYNYFCNEFGKENVVSAKVHLDETTPHMHLHFVPISQEGKLQARKVMTPPRINKIHTEAVKWLQGREFDVTRGKGETGKKNIKDIHKFKSEKLKDEVEQLENKKNELISVIDKALSGNKTLKDIEEIELDKLDFKNSMLSKDKIVIKESDFKNIINLYEDSIELNKHLKNKVIDLDIDNTNLSFEINKFKKREEDLLEERKYLMNKQEYLRKSENLLIKREKVAKKEILEVEEKFKKVLDNKDLEINNLKHENSQNKKSYKVMFDVFNNSYEWLNLQNEQLKKLCFADSLVINEIIKVHGKSALNEFKRELDLNKMCVVFLDGPKNHIKLKEPYKFNDARNLINGLKQSQELSRSNIRYEIYENDFKEFKLNLGEFKLSEIKDVDFKSYLFKETSELPGFLHKNILINSIRSDKSDQPSKDKLKEKEDKLKEKRVGKELSIEQLKVLQRGQEHDL